MTLKKAITYVLVAFLTGKIKVTVQKATGAFLSIANLPVYHSNPTNLTEETAERKEDQIVPLGGVCSLWGPASTDNTLAPCRNSSGQILAGVPLETKRDRARLRYMLTGRSNPHTIVV